MRYNILFCAAFLILASGCLRVNASKINISDLDFGPFPNDYVSIVSSYIRKEIDDLVSYKVSDVPPEKEAASKQMIFDKISGKSPHYGWAGTVFVVTNKKEYVVVGRKWVKTKNGGFYANVYSNHKVITGKIHKTYKYYIINDKVIWLEPQDINKRIESIEKVYEAIKI